MSQDVSNRQKLTLLWRVITFQPIFVVGIVALSLFAAVLEGIGLSFLFPILEEAQFESTGTGRGTLTQYFIDAYELLGIPFELEYIITGVAVVMIARYVSSFLVAWFRTALQTNYVRSTQSEAFRKALDAKVSYYDKAGSDEILNIIITQANEGGYVIHHTVDIFQQSFMVLIYLGIALFLAPELTVGSIVVLGGFLLIIRYAIDSAYSVGDQVAEAKQRVQTSVQAGTQGIRDVKLFTMTDELFRGFREAINQFARSNIALRRNKAGMDNLYQLSISLIVFGLIYAALEFTSLSLAGLGVFLFAMFRLAPRISGLNSTVYNLEGRLPHLWRSLSFIDELERQQELNKGGEPVPDPINRTSFEQVTFMYEEEQQVLDGISFTVDRGEFVAFVGESGAGKSTIASLLARMYEPCQGRITADRTPIQRFDIEEWRQRISVVRQRPFVFNDTLRYNLTIGDRDATRTEIEEVCEVAEVTEFLDSLPDGYDSVLGDDGVRLSGGQRQRVALARALLKDADLLILDEATSDLDSNIEERVHAGIEAMDRDYAMIVIAHRLSTVTNADRIYTVEDGRITESGTHDELLRNGGKYAELYHLQTQDA